MISTDDVARLTGITYRRLDYWARQGWLDVPAAGSGRKDRDWPDKEIEIAKLIAKISDAGITPRKAARIARTIVNNPSDDPTKTKRTVRIGTGVWVVVETGE